jgi:hypothetical protein
MYIRTYAFDSDESRCGVYAYGSLLMRHEKNSQFYVMTFLTPPKALVIIKRVSLIYIEQLFLYSEKW